MTPLRTTRPRPARTRRLAVFCAVGLVLAGSAGCGSNQRAAGGPNGGGPEPMERTAAGKRLPPPDTDRIEYHADSRTLTFYDLPGSARWMVWLPNAPFPIPAGPEHKLPGDADPDETFVYYARPGGTRSFSVSLRQIQASRGLHASTIR